MFQDQDDLTQEQADKCENASINYQKHKHEMSAADRLAAARGILEMSIDCLRFKSSQKSISYLASLATYFLPNGNMITSLIYVMLEVAEAKNALEKEQCVRSTADDNVKKIGGEDNVL